MSRALLPGVRRVTRSALLFDVPSERTQGRFQPPLPAPSLTCLWEDLLGGARKVTASACDEMHCRLSLSDGEWPPAPASALARERRALLESAILGEAQKVLAMDLHRSNATVSTALHAGLQAMGLSCKFRCLPLSLALLAHAARRNDAVPRPSLVREGDTWIVTFTRPDWALRARLSRGEYEVARLALEGKTHAEMALLRRVSDRTIANQLQSIFSKAKVTGRFQLLRVALDGQLRSVSSVI